MAASVRLPAEEMPLGVEIDCGAHELTEAEIIEFGSLWDPQYFHIDPDAAAHSTFGGVIASGVHTTAIFQRLATLAVYNRYDVIAGREIRSLRFLTPVRAGDVLTGSVVLRSIAPARRGRCLVTIAGTLTNQEGVLVLTLEVDSLVRSRLPSGE
ncbi:hypothetical protein BA895_11540 [Humibacillus sp. DSM 29435]|uniref:MaoC/PaaZ C-terminal domain-containing protein n=1 Tax=Humibacillus sp. DSM 29435 TaxID=1869167 RepID=UPI0008730998|nr:MaoC/PaaZ C-terminal domain-containing protein [Humibacillus sp. DSM 29435]OFE14237.1 hypothetical protein BA895_11540 [Humibacillus sp. DSM 29435]